MSAADLPRIACCLPCGPPCSLQGLRLAEYAAVFYSSSIPAQSGQSSSSLTFGATQMRIDWAYLRKG